MLLSDHDIHIAINTGRITISPFEAALVQPASVDVRLGDSLRMFRDRPGVSIDPGNLDDDDTHVITCIPGQPFVLSPRMFVLGTTMETIGVDRTLAAQIEGKSTLGRCGLVVHSTAGFIDPGFCGQITLELSNVGHRPIVLRPGSPIGQVCFVRMSSPVDRPYGSPGLGSHYQGQRGPTVAKSG